MNTTLKIHRGKSNSQHYKLLRASAQLRLNQVIRPIVHLLLFLRVTPNMITTTGFILNLGVAGIFVYGAESGARSDHTFVGWAGVGILVAGLFDMLDGQVARMANASSRFGALYDSVIDRYSELFMFFGITYYLVAHDYFLSSVFSFFALIGSMMVSYVRARAETLGVECREGLMQRPERVILLGTSAALTGLFHYYLGNHIIILPGTSIQVFETISIFTVPIAITAFLTNLTAIRRIQFSRRELESIN